MIHIFTDGLLLQQVDSWLVLLIKHGAGWLSAGAAIAALIWKRKEIRSTYNSLMLSKIDAQLSQMEAHLKGIYPELWDQYKVDTEATYYSTRPKSAGNWEGEINHAKLGLEHDDMAHMFGSRNRYDNLIKLRKLRDKYQSNLADSL